LLAGFRGSFAFTINRRQLNEGVATYGTGKARRVLAACTPIEGASALTLPDRECALISASGAVSAPASTGSLQIEAAGNIARSWACFVLHRRFLPAVRWHSTAKRCIDGASLPAFATAAGSARTGGFLLRRGGGGDQGRPGVRTRGRGFTVQHPVQRDSVNAPSAADATGKARGDATPSRYGLHGYANKRRRLPRSKIGPLNHRKTPHGCGDGKGLRHYAARQRVFPPCVNAPTRAFFPSEIPTRNIHRLGLRTGPLFPCKEKAGRFVYRARLSALCVDLAFRFSAAFVACFVREREAQTAGSRGDSGDCVTFAQSSISRPTRRVVAVVATTLLSPSNLAFSPQIMPFPVR